MECKFETYTAEIKYFKQSPFFSGWAGGSCHVCSEWPEHTRARACKHLHMPYTHQRFIGMFRQWGTETGAKYRQGRGEQALVCSSAWNLLSSLENIGASWAAWATFSYVLYMCTYRCVWESFGASHVISIILTANGTERFHWTPPPQQEYAQLWYL